MRAFISVSLAPLVLLICSAAVSAGIIDFTALSEGNNPNPLVLPGATFTTISGFNFVANVLGSNWLCPSTSSANGGDCSRNLEVLFDAPSSGISFVFVGNNETSLGADIGDVQLFAGATLLGTANVIVIDGNFLSLDLVNLDGFSGVTRLLISSTDSGGVLYKDFTFTPSSAVPEPASWIMVIAGVGLIGAKARRRP